MWDIREFIRNLSNLSTIPAVHGKILTMTRDENTPPDELYRLILHDQAIAQRMIRMANSPMFGHQGMVRDLQQAIMFLGYNKIKSIALGMAVMEIFPARRSFSMNNLWVHSCEVAFLAGIVAESLVLMSPRETFLSGLLHDVGRLVLHAYDKNLFARLPATDDLLEIETELFGCTHAEAGGWFAEENGFPEEIVSTIFFHHAPSRALSYGNAVAVVSLAEVLARRYNPRIEDDGIWTQEHNAILLEFGFTDDILNDIGARYFGARGRIEGFFKD